VQDPPWEKERTKLDFGGNYSFAAFDMSKPVEVTIKSTNKALDHTILRPDAVHVSNVTTSASEVSFVVEKPGQIIVEPDGKNGPLLLFANPIDDFVPNLNDPNLIYYGPGIHHPDTALIEVGDNQTLYLAEGAVVKAGVRVRGNNVTICGRGMICGNEFVWGKFSRNAILIEGSNHVVVKDIILRGCATWTMPIRHSANVVVDNVKIVAGRAQNDDGINPCNSQDVLIKNCFIRTDDDCIAVKGIRFLPNVENNVERITVENSILWCDRARIFLLGHESRAEYMRNMVFRNLDIVHFSMTAFLLEPGEKMRLENIVFDDIRIHGEGQRELIRLKPVVNQYMHTQLPGYVNNVSFKNMTVTGTSGPYKIQLIGADEEYTVSNVIFDHLSISGQRVTPDYKQYELGEFVSGATFN
jgi:polygalacturonase